VRAFDAQLCDLGEEQRSGGSGGGHVGETVGEVGDERGGNNNQ